MSPEKPQGQKKVQSPETSQGSKELQHPEKSQGEKVRWQAGIACIARRNDGIWYFGEVVEQVEQEQVMVEFQEPSQDWEAVDICRLVSVVEVGDLEPGDAMHPRVLEMAKKERVVKVEKQILGDQIFSLVEKQHPRDRAIIIATMIMNSDVPQLRLLLEDTSRLNQKVLIQALSVRQEC